MASNKAVSWKRFPIGKLARKRRTLKESYLAADSETVRLQNELNVIEKDVNKMAKSVGKLYNLVINIKLNFCVCLYGILKLCTLLLRQKCKRDKENLLQDSLLRYIFRSHIHSVILGQIELGHMRIRTGIYLYI